MSEGASAGQAMSARPSYGFRLPVWRSKADKLAQALGDYAVEPGSVRITPLFGWRSWGISIGVGHFTRREQIRSTGSEWRVDGHVQVGPCVLLVDVSSSYVHRNFMANEATQMDEHATQAMPSGSGPGRITAQNRTAGQPPRAIPLISAGSKMPTMPTRRSP